jgi:hypothetical protein
VRWLAERRFDEAAAAMARADGHPDRLRRRQAFRLRIYSLCMAGRLEEAQSLARERYVSQGAPSELPRFWSWLRENFGIDPQRSEAERIASPHRPVRAVSSNLPSMMAAMTAVPRGRVPSAASQHALPIRDTTGGLRHERPASGSVRARVRRRRPTGLRTAWKPGTRLCLPEPS